MMMRVILICIVSLFANSCSHNFDVDKPVDLLWDKNGKKNHNLIIFLPGLYDTADTFKKEKFFAIARKAGIKADMVAASIHIGHLIKEMMLMRIETDIFQHAKDVGYDNIWLVGVSLGGLNSLLFYQKHKKDICGVVVLAPYLADEALTKELQQAGEIKNWQPKSAEKKVLEQKLQSLWVWLKEQDSKNLLKQIFLGYGKQDRYIEAMKILQSTLDKKNITAVEGKHGWIAGRKIWQQQLISRTKSGLLQPCMKI